MNKLCKIKIKIKQKKKKSNLFCRTHALGKKHHYHHFDLFVQSSCFLKPSIINLMINLLIAIRVKKKKEKGKKKTPGSGGI